MHITSGTITRWGAYALFIQDDLGDTAQTVVEEPGRFHRGEPVVIASRLSER